MDVTLRELQAKVRNVALDARALSRVVESEAFRKAWSVASAEQCTQLSEYIQGIDKQNVDKWIRRVLAAVSLEDKSVRELRNLAKAAGVTYVNSRTKEDLVKKIREDDGEPGQADVDGGGDHGASGQVGAQGG